LLIGNPERFAEFILRVAEQDAAPPDALAHLTINI
jgi:hypothetical protein